MFKKLFVSQAKKQVKKINILIAVEHRLWNGLLAISKRILLFRIMKYCADTLIVQQELNDFMVKTI